MSGNGRHRAEPPDPSILEPGGRPPAPGRLAVVQAFVNTRNDDFASDALGDGARMRAWLASRALPGAAEADDLDAAAARRLREALRALLLPGGPDDEAGRALRLAASAARLTLRLEAGALVLVPEADGVAGAIGEVLAATQAAMLDGTWQRMKTCRQCRWAFFDRSRNASGQWCSMGICGNRVKTRRHRSRRLEATT